MKPAESASLLQDTPALGGTYPLYGYTITCLSSLSIRSTTTTTTTKPIQGRQKAPPELRQFGLLEFLSANSPYPFIRRPRTNWSTSGIHLQPSVKRFDAEHGHRSRAASMLVLPRSLQSRFHLLLLPQTTKASFCAAAAHQMAADCRFISELLLSIRELFPKAG